MDVSHKNMDVSGRGDIMLQEEHRIQHKIKVLVSTDFSQDELIVGLEDLKVFGILHREFQKTLPERKREHAKQFNVQYNSIRGDQWNAQMASEGEEGKRERSPAIPGREI